MEDPGRASGAFAALLVLKMFLLWKCGCREANSEEVSRARNGRELRGVGTSSLGVSLKSLGLEGENRV
jgi:hypothetical protein